MSRHSTSRPARATSPALTRLPPRRSRSRWTGVPARCGSRPAPSTTQVERSTRRPRARSSAAWRWGSARRSARNWSTRPAKPGQPRLPRLSAAPSCRSPPDPNDRHRRPEDPHGPVRSQGARRDLLVPPPPRSPTPSHMRSGFRIRELPITPDRELAGSAGRRPARRDGAIVRGAGRIAGGSPPSAAPIRTAVPGVDPSVRHRRRDHRRPRQIALLPPPDALRRWPSSRWPIDAIPLAGGTDLISRPAARVRRPPPGWSTCAWSLSSRELETNRRRGWRLADRMPNSPELAGHLLAPQELTALRGVFADRLAPDP